jgi:aldehyde:ferredoxin oxidoreductase
MGTGQMRVRHDTVPEWVFADPEGKAAFEKGTNRMDRDDIARAMDLFYQEMGWDKVSGAPTRAAYQRVGLAHVAQELAEKGLLPG